MKPERKLNLLGILLMSLTLTFITGCDKNDDIPEDPANTVTLNMLNEQNGKTLLGTSDVYINKSNNFRASSDFISDAGNASGVGVKIDPQINNLVREAAVVPGHIYQIFNKFTLLDFPSGNQAVPVGEGYYQVYVVSPITSDNVSTGAMVKYFLAYPDKKDLPDWKQDFGRLYYAGETIEMAVPKNAECFIEEHYGSGEAGVFTLSTSAGKLRITLNKSPNHVSGPYGTYSVYIRSGNIYTRVLVNVEL